MGGAGREGCMGTSAALVPSSARGEGERHAGARQEQEHDRSMSMGGAGREGCAPADEASAGGTPSPQRSSTAASSPLCATNRPVLKQMSMRTPSLPSALMMGILAPKTMKGRLRTAPASCGHAKPGTQGRWEGVRPACVQCPPPVGVTNRVGTGEQAGARDGWAEAGQAGRVAARRSTAAGTRACADEGGCTRQA